MIEQQVNMSFFARIEPDFKTYVYMLLRFDKYIMSSGNRYLLDDLYVSTSLGIEIDFYLKYKNQYPCKDKKRAYKAHRKHDIFGEECFQ